MDEAKLNQERINMETLIAGRFNYLIVVFAVVMAGLTASRSHLHFQLVLCAGFLITAVLGLTLARVQLKQSLLFDEIRANHPDHPASVIDRRAGRLRWWHWLDVRRYRAQHLIGYLFPFLIPMVFLAAFLFSDRLYMEDRTQARLETLEKTLAKQERALESLQSELDLLRASPP